MADRDVIRNDQTIGRVRYRTEARGWEWVDNHGVMSDQFFTSQAEAEDDLVFQVRRYERAARRA